MNGTVAPSPAKERTAVAELTVMFVWVDWNQVSKVICCVDCACRGPDRGGGRDHRIHALPHGRDPDTVLRTIRRTDSSRVISVISSSAIHRSDFDSAVTANAASLSASNRNRMS